MQIVVIADGEKQKKFQDKEIPEGVLIQFFADTAEVKQDAEGYFYLHNKERLQKDLQYLEKLQAPVFVVEADNIESLPDHIAIIEGWPDFLFQTTVKVHFHKEKRKELAKVLNVMQWDFEPEMH